MNDIEPQTTGLPSKGRAATALLLGVLQLGALLAYGLLLESTQLLPLGILVLAPLFVMMLVIAIAPRAQRPTQLGFLAMVPVAVGLVVITLLVGTFVLPGSVAWWVAGAIASAVPFVLISIGWMRPSEK